MLPQRIAFGTPRRLPKPASLPGKVAVLDIAFAAGGKHSGFEGITLPFIRGLGERLVAWIDHHDHDEHVNYARDRRFVLCTKAEHGACPEMITPEVVSTLGPADTVVCHTDFDGLASAAKWMRNGFEPYPGCDDDARAIDTRLGEPSAVANRFDRALRGRPRDTALFTVIVQHLYEGLTDEKLWAPIDAAGAELLSVEKETRHAAGYYKVLAPGVAVIDARVGFGTLEKTLLLLLGQERAPVSVVIDTNNVSVAARFDSGYNFLELFGLAGGMPTRVSLSHKQLPQILTALGVSKADQAQVL